MSDRLTLRSDVYVHLQDFDFIKAEPEEVNRLLDRAAVEFQQATKLLRRRQPVRIVSGLGSLAPRGSVVSVTMTVGSAYVDTATVSFTAAPSGGTTATGVPVIDGGLVRDVIITHPGEGYIVAPTITVSAGTTATGTAVRSAQTVASVTMTNNGSGYTSVPDVAFSGGGGTGAGGTAVLSGQTVASVTMTAAGSGYTSDPTVTFTGGHVGTGASGTTTIDGPAGQGFAGEILWAETSTNVRLVRTHEAKMDVLFGAAWKATASGTPTRFMHGRDGQNLIRVHPPLTAGYIYVWYAGMPASMTTDNDQPEFDAIYHDALPWWVTARLLTVGGGPADKVGEAMAHWTGFIEAAKLAVARMDAL